MSAADREGDKDPSNTQKERKLGEQRSISKRVEDQKGEKIKIQHVREAAGRKITDFLKGEYLHFLISLYNATHLH